MGIINRTMDSSEQQEAFKINAKTVANTNEFPVFIAERAATIKNVSSTCFGISGAPTGMLRVSRAVGTTFNVGLTFLIPAVGVSQSLLAASLPAAGATSLNLQKGDVVSCIFGGGTGAAADHAVIDVVVQNLQDIKTWY